MQQQIFVPIEVIMRNIVLVIELHLRSLFISSIFAFKYLFFEDKYEKNTIKNRMSKYLNGSSRAQKMKKDVFDK